MVTLSKKLNMTRLNIYLQCDNHQQIIDLLYCTVNELIFIGPFVALLNTLILPQELRVRPELGRIVKVGFTGSIDYPVQLRLKTFVFQINVQLLHGVTDCLQKQFINFLLSKTMFNQNVKRRLQELHRVCFFLCRRVSAAAP